MAVTIMDDDRVTDLRGTLYSAGEVVALLPTLTYRMLDRWCRLGYVRCAFPADGSGTPRMFTEADLAGIRAVVAASDESERLWQSIRSGSAFTEAWARAIRRQVNS